MAAGPIVMTRRVIGARELLRNLTSREIKVRYKRSVLGLFWTLLNPLLTMIVFTVVLSKAFRLDIEWGSIYFLSAYLPFSFFQTCVFAGTGAVVNNASLISKVAFPREVLPVSAVMAQFVHLAFAMAVFMPFVFLVRSPWRASLIVLLPALILMFVFCVGVALLLSALNTKVRDIQEFQGVAMMIAFYMTPVIYLKENLPPKYQTIINLNPLTHFVSLFRSALYTREFPTAQVWGITIGCTVFTLVLGAYVFNRLSTAFAKEL